MENESNKEDTLVGLTEIIDENQGKLDTEDAVKYEEVTPMHLLGFAKAILGCVGLIFVISGLTELCHPGNSFWEGCKITMPSLATLVIGYYFGTTRS